MAQAATFRWDERARLFAGDIEIERPKTGQDQPFKQIACEPTAAALSDIGAALSGNCGFCVSERPLPPDLETDSDHFLTLTGGSSGQPKIVRRSQVSWVSSFEVNAVQFDFTKEDSIAVFGKLSHSLALYGVLEALHLGLNAFALDGLGPRTQRAVLAHHGISVLYATPTQLRLLAHSQGEELPDVRLILCGGGDLNPSTRAAAKTLCPNAALHVFYGAAETSFITLADANTPDGCVGQTYPGVVLRVLDKKGVPTTGVGDVWVQSPYLFKGYMANDPADTRWKDGFVTVGEMGEIDADGNLWIKGRKTRMITIADQNVFPEDIETLISTNPQFGTCAVIPVPDKTRGHRLVAVLQGGQNAEIAHAIRDFCHEKLGGLMTPHKVLFHPSLPLLGSGKIDLVNLSDWVEGQL
ncbi:ANL family adenylate-forming protein [Sulfitobacter sp. MF3-043]|uniref:ANL family adenylate-forming protein n=1 Tax=Sulfitobacter sediminivivens TaxID=3252902 RepID=UPI0036DA5559